MKTFEPSNDREESELLDNIVVLLNVFLLSIPVIYSINSSLKKNFQVFSPVFFPFVYFSLYYLVPCLIKLWADEFHAPFYLKWLHLFGINMFLVGVLVSNIIRRRRKIHISLNFEIFKIQDIMQLLFLGLFFLAVYGFISTIPFQLIKLGNIEQLRRVAEIGKGYIKIPGILFTSMAILFLCGKRLAIYKRLNLLDFLIFLGGSAAIFITTGHKSPALLPWIILLGLYSKYSIMNVRKLMLVGISLFIVIGTLTYLRGGGAGKSIYATIIHQGFGYFYHVYEANYLSILVALEEDKLGFQDGKEYLDNMKMIIPRFLYPDKPLSFDYYLKEKLGRKFEGGGLPPTMIGSLYLNFGLKGVILGMLMIGFAYNILYYRFLNTVFLSKAVIYLFVLYYFINPSQFFLNLEQLLLIFYLPYCLLVLFKKWLLYCLVKYQLHTTCTYVKERVSMNGSIRISQ